MSSKFFKALILGISFFVTSCSNLGSTMLPPDRLSYNSALAGSDLEQQLLNIVRLRYTDAPFFLSVNNVVSQFSFGSDITVNVNNQAPPPAIIGSGNAAFNYSEAPTITYSPLQGEEYITKLLTPVNLSVIYMMLRTGWSMNHVLRVTVQRFGRLNNAVLASRTISSVVPEFKEFEKLGLVFLDAHHQSNFEFEPDTYQGKFAIKVIFKRYKLLTAKQRALVAKIGVSKKTPYFLMVQVPTEEEGKIYVETRTVLGLLNYLSKGVDVPEYDIANHQVRMTYYPDGRLFDWHAVTVGMVRIHTSPTKPENAFIKVRYRGSYFYVDNSDFDTKETFNLLSLIMGIYQGKIQSFLPVFTIS